MNTCIYIYMYKYVYVFRVSEAIQLKQHAATVFDASGPVPSELARNTA